MARNTKRDLAPGPGQLQMLMSAREIMNQYQVLDGDRQHREDDRAGMPTWRSHTTGGGTNPEIDTRERQWLAPMMERHGTSLASQTHYRGGEHDETDEQVWERKTEEASLSPADYKAAREGSGAQVSVPGWDTMMARSSAPKMGSSWEHGHRGYTSAQESHDLKAQSYMDRRYDQIQQDAEYGPSLIDHLRETGGVEAPVRLGTEHGSQGKPEVIGGHHRIAAMGHINPDQLMPVVHDVNLWHARPRDPRNVTTSQRAYPYT